MANQPLKMNAVLRSGSEDWQDSSDKILEICKNNSVMFLQKFRKPISCFQIKDFFIVCCSVFLLWSLFLFARLTIIRTTKWQRTHINKGSNINEVINYNYEIMAKSRYDGISNFPKKYLIFSYLGVTLSSCNMQDNFCFT